MSAPHPGAVRGGQQLAALGLKLAERGGKNGRKRAVIVTARKPAGLLHRLWVSGEVYELWISLGF